MKLFNHGGNCQLHACEFALYFAMELEQTNLGDLCLIPKQTKILLNVWRGKDVTVLQIGPTAGYWKVVLILHLLLTRSRTRAGQDLEIQQNS